MAGTYYLHDHNGPIPSGIHITYLGYDYNTMRHSELVLELQVSIHILVKGPKYVEASIIVDFPKRPPLPPD